MKIFLALFLALPVSLFGQGTIFSSITRTNALTSTNLFLTSTPVPGGTRTIYFSDLITSLATNGGVITDVIASDALKFSKLGDSAANAFITNYLDRAIRTLSGLTPTLDLSLEGSQYLTLSGNTTVTIANAPSGAKQRIVILNVLGDGTRTIAFAGTAVNWLSAQHSPPPATWIKYRFEWNGAEVQGAVEAPLLASELPATPHSIGITVDGGGSTVTTGVKGYVIVPVAGTVTGWNIVADGASPTCTFDVWKIATGTALPTIANTIMGTKPALATGNAVRSTTITSWTSTFSAGDIFAFNVDAVTTATRITFQLETLQ